MARPSKLTPEQWAEITRRLVAGERAADLAREFGISKASISVRVNKRAETVKAIANQLVRADSALRSLPVSEQLITLDLAASLRSISSRAAQAADNGMAVAARLSGIAKGMVEMIDDADPAASGMDLRVISGLMTVSKESAHIGLNLLAANKGDAFKTEAEDVPNDLGHFYGQ